MTQLPRIMVAPNGARRTRNDHPNIPVTISQTVETARLCHAAGAGAIHAHVRDEDQKHILDAGLYKELIGEIHHLVPEMLVQITTEAVGIYSAQEQRKLISDVKPPAVSIGLMEMISDGDFQATRRTYHSAQDLGIAVQHIVYSADELVRLFQLMDDGVIPSDGLQLLFVLGRYTKGQQSDPSMLAPFLSVLDTNIQRLEWAVCAFGKGETTCLTAAAKAGGKVRVGFENSLFAADGSVAESNEQRVREMSLAIEGA